MWFQRITREEKVYYLSDQGDGPGLNRNPDAWRQQWLAYHHANEDDHHE